VSIQKTQAEQALATHFQDVVGRLPGVESVTKERKAAIAQFEALGLPHRRIEAWKYTDLRNTLKTAFAPAADKPTASWQAVEVALGPLMELDAARFVLVDGAYVAELSSIDDLGEGVQVMPLAQALGGEMFAELHGKLLEIEPDHSVVALNTAFMTDGAALHITASPRRAIHIIHVVSGTTERMVSTRNVINVGPDVEVTLVESFVAFEDKGAQVNSLTHVGADARATVHHVKVQRENTASTHLSTWVVELGAEADYHGFQFSTGAGMARSQVALKFQGEGARADISGVDLVRGRQHCDTTLVIDHAVAGCESRELFKLVLDDEARGVFQGKVIVRPDAQKSDGKQMAQALMLSEHCEFDSKPELEIYADDVACGHGATCAEIDPDLVFYCRSRGINEEVAKALITESFVAEAIEKVEDATIGEALSELARAWLAQRAAKETGS
jgi:Fe-S cluster assembly protein SufD